MLRRADDGHWVGSFRAMAGPCEVLIDTPDREDARRVLAVVSAEALRVERKFSRYRDDSVVHRIHAAGGRAVAVDDETARLLDYAARLHELSDGRFDVTSGVLREVWTFDGGDRVPDPDDVRAVLSRVGWNRVGWDGRTLHLPRGMQIDLGGIGKEYAVDRAAALAGDAFHGSTLVNFGGDLRVLRPRTDGTPWRVGVESPDVEQPTAEGIVGLLRGGLATSGDARRFLLRDGVRYGHILDPSTGWPVEGAPRSVTVVASTCTEAGMLATFAMLRGADAESFLAEQEVRHRVRR